MATLAAFAPAATLTWDPTLTPAAPIGGTGTWDAATANWSNGAANVAWTTVADTAAFGGVGGTVTLGSDVAVRGLAFNATGYTLDGPHAITLGAGGIVAPTAATNTLAIKTGLALTGNTTVFTSNRSTVTFDGVISGSGDLTFDAQGTDPQRSQTFINLNAANTFAGNTTINVNAVAGNNTGAKALIELNLGVNNALPVGGLLTLSTGNRNFSSAVVKLNGKSQTVAGLVGTGNETNSQILGPGTLTIDGTGTNAFSGLIGGATVLVKAGPGTQVLSGNNSFTGGTTISAGVLVANNATASLGTKATVVNGGTLAGNGATGGAVTVNSGGRITAGDGPAATDSAGRLTSGNQIWSPGGKFAVKFHDNTAGPVNANGTRAGGTAATWDALAMPTLDLRGLSSGGRFRIDALTAVGGAFTPGTSAEFVIAAASKIQTAAATAGITARTDLTALFTLDTTGLGVPEDHFRVVGVYNSVGSADLVLSYDAAPEPGTMALILLAATPLLGRRRKF